jgi:hypothetical protein
MHIVWVYGDFSPTLYIGRTVREVMAFMLVNTALNLLIQLLIHSGILWGLGDAQRQARELISGTFLGAKARFLSFTRTQSRAVTGLLTGHNTLRKHLHLMGLSDRPLCRRCRAEDETTAHILCECEALTSLRHSYLGSSSLEPEDIKSISLGAIWNFSKATGLP